LPMKMTALMVNKMMDKIVIFFITAIILIASYDG